MSLPLPAIVMMSPCRPGDDLLVQQGGQGRSSSSDKEGVMGLIIGGVSVAVLCVALLFLAVFWRPVWCADTCDTAEQEAAEQEAAATSSSDDDNSAEAATGCKEASVSL